MRKSIVLVAVLWACGGGSTSSGGGSAASSPAPARGSADLITEQEIARSTYPTALEIIQNLRPSMIRPRSTSPSAGDSYPVIFVDEIRLGDIQSLRTIPAPTVRMIRYISARDATTRWGTGFPSGVVQVVTKK